MKKTVFILLILSFFSQIGFSQDSLKSKLKKASHNMGKASKKATKAAGKAFDTAMHKTGTFVKKTSTTVASEISRSTDKSLKGPKGETVYNGPRGGKYFINKAGNKVYLKKDAPQPEKN
jgi:colicin import membrane protein